jgi:hypothetical protein
VLLVRLASMDVDPVLRRLLQERIEKDFSHPNDS